MPGFEVFGEEEKKHINEVMDLGILARYGFDAARKGVWKSNELEKEIVKVFGCSYAQLTSSGTAALTTALSALGIGYGDEVIIPSFTFVASFEAVLSVGAIPILVDIDDTLTLSPIAVEAAITPATKCVMPVHMCGSMADLDALLDICTRHNLVLLEDACQSIGGSYKGKRLGTIGHAGTFSFDFVKTITCGEGGVVMTNDKDIYVKSDAYSDHGHDHKGADRGADEHPFLGYNYRISELHAAIGLAQIGKLESILSKQRKNHSILKSILSPIEQITFRRIPDVEGDNCAFLSWFLPTEADMRKAIAKIRELGAWAGNFYWYDNNWHYIRNWAHFKEVKTLNKYSETQQQAMQKASTQDFSISDGIMSRCVSTAISLSWTEEQIVAKGEAMATAIRSIF